MPNPAPNPAYGKAYPLLLEKTAHWHAYTHHAFVEGLRDGSLPRKAFLHYLKQDYVYLLHYARAWSLGVAKADTLSEMQACNKTVHFLVSGEMKLHVDLCAEAGISRDELEATVEANGNLAYTRFVLEAGYSGDFLTLLAALMPCVFGYGEIGTRLMYEKTSDTYLEWISTYAGERYQTACQEAGEFFDQAIVRRLGEDYATLPIWKTICKTFDQATQLEVGFWDMGLKPD